MDLEGGVVHVTKAWDEEAGEVKPPKTAMGVRDVPIPETLVPLLERMGEGRGPAELVTPIVAGTPESKRAPRFVRSLRAAGVTRARLFESTPTTMGVNFRSLRDSGITWLALAGVDVQRIQRRAGHDDVKTTIGYVKQAEDIGGRTGDPFGPLPASLLEGVMGAGDVPPKSRGRRPRYEPRAAPDWPKFRAKSTLENYMLPKLLTKSVEAGGVEPPSENVPSRPLRA